MSDSREDSPDWLRSFQPPTSSALESPSVSELPSESSDDEDGLKLSQLFKRETKLELGDDEDIEAKDEPRKGKSQTKVDQVKGTPKRRREVGDGSEREGKFASKKHSVSNNQQIWALSSDSDSSHDTNLVRTDIPSKKDVPSSNQYTITRNAKSIDDNPNGKQNIKPELKGNSPAKQMKEEVRETADKIMDSIRNVDNDTKKSVVNEESARKVGGTQGSTTRLPLLLSEKVQRSKALVECEGESIDLSGDVGSVGRVVISDDPSRNHEMMLDLKGTIYKTTIVPSRTFCVVSFGPSEAKIEAIMNDYIQLKPISNVYEAETMVEGTLDGFSFDSEDEADKKPTAKADQQEVTEDQQEGKTKRKTDKGVSRKKGKSAAVKLPKKVKKKARVTSKTRTKK